MKRPKYYSQLDAPTDEMDIKFQYADMLYCSHAPGSLTKSRSGTARLYRIELWDKNLNYLSTKENTRVKKYAAN
jgi:hypothetical protein